MDTELWRTSGPKRAPWLRPPLVALAAYLLVLFGLGWFFLHRETGQLVDQFALMGAKLYVIADGGLIVRITAVLGHIVDPAVKVIGGVFAIVLVLVTAAVTLWRRTWWLGGGALVLFAGANLTTQGIKAFLARPDLGLYEAYGNSWPSGHTTFAAAAGFAVLLITPGRWRPLVAVLGWSFTTAVAWATLLNGWHRPSDTVAAICVAAIWYVLVEGTRRAVVRVPLENPIPYRITSRIHDVLAGTFGAVGIGILAAVTLILPEGPIESADPSVQRLAFVGAVFGIAAFAIGTSRILLAIGPREEPHN